MVNFRIDVTHEGTESLRLAMQIAFKQYANAVAYRVDPEKGLVFYWTKSDHATALPFKLNHETASDFAINWLAEQDYGKQPDHDGDNGKGWRLYCEDWGHIGSEYQAFVAVKPAWAMYGK